MKKILSVIVAVVLVLSAFMPAASAITHSQDIKEIGMAYFEAVALDDLEEEERKLLEAYIAVADYAYLSNVELEISFELFVEKFRSSEYDLLEDFLTFILEFLRLQANEEPDTEVGEEPDAEIDEEPDAEVDEGFGARFGGSAYYYNTGLNLPGQATFGRYLLLPNIRKGDILHEEAGFFGLTGHSGIVEGKFFCTSRRIFFPRIIESIDAGVVRSIIDDRRIDDRDGIILRVSSATTTQIHNAVQFAVSQLGKPYPTITFWNLAGRNPAANSTTWYCSELVWAAFFHQNINIDGNTSGTVWPRSIRDHSSTATISIIGVFPGNRFTDISLMSVANRNAIIFLANNGITTGVTQTSFAPTRPVTRGEMITFLYRMAGEPRVTGTMPFNDVPANAFFRDAVLWGHNRGIVTGTTATTFSPNNTVTREQVATFLHRYALAHVGFSTSFNAILNHPDRNQVSDWALNAMFWAFTRNPVQILFESSGMLRPRTDATRAEVALALHGLVQRR